MAFNFPLKFPFLDDASPQAEESSVQSDKEESTGLVGGFPFVNYGEQRYKSASALVLPRPKYTWFAEFDVNQDYIDSDRLSTNLRTFLVNNHSRIYLNLKRIDHPKPNMTFDTIRSHNKYVKIPMKVEYPPAQMTLDDDATSIVAALWKEYFAFYSHTGDVGFEKLLASENLVSADEDNAFSIEENMGSHGYGHLVSSEGTEPRRSMDIRASMGMRLKQNQHRHFFNRIVLYDLGTEPSSVNVYYYYRPVITSFDHGDLDWEDRTGKVEANVTFEYENYYFALGINISKVAEVVERVTGVKPTYTPNPTPVNSHGKMITPKFSGIPPTTDGPKPVLIGDEGPRFTEPPAPPPEEPVDLQKEKDRVLREYQRVLSECSSAQNSKVCIDQKETLTEQLDLIDAEIVKSQTYYSREETISRSDPDTQDAVSNTEAENGITTNNPKTTDAVVTNQDLQNLNVQLGETRLSKSKLQNTANSLFDSLLAFNKTLSASDNGQLPGANPTYSPEQRDAIEQAIESVEKQLEDVNNQIVLVSTREEQLVRTIDNVTTP